MRHRMGKVQKERVFSVFSDKSNCLFCISFGQCFLLYRALNDDRISHQRDIPRRHILLSPRSIPISIFPFYRIHVVRIGNAIELVKPMTSRQEFRVVTEMPLSDTGRRIVPFLQNLRHRHFGRVQTDPMTRKQDSSNPNPSRIAARQQCGPGSGTNGCQRIKIRKPSSLSGHSIEIRCLDIWRTITAKILIPLIIDENEDEIRWPLRTLRSSAPKLESHQNR
jgi:hypothetical protein